MLFSHVQAWEGPPPAVGKHTHATKHACLDPKPHDTCKALRDQTLKPSNGQPCMHARTEARPVTHARMRAWVSVHAWSSVHACMPACVHGSRRMHAHPYMQACVQAYACTAAMRSYACAVTPPRTVILRLWQVVKQAGAALRAAAACGFRTAPLGCRALLLVAVAACGTRLQQAAVERQAQRHHALPAATRARGCAAAAAVCDGQRHRRDRCCGRRRQRIPLQAGRPRSAAAAAASATAAGGRRLRGRGVCVAAAAVAAAGAVVGIVATEKVHRGCCCCCCRCCCRRCCCRCCRKARKGPRGRVRRRPTERRGRDVGRGRRSRGAEAWSRPLRR
eukprot:358688-Chlamydomonas_euryale.AAC.2